MSRVILAKPTNLPPCRIGSTTTAAQKWLPSLRTRQPCDEAALFCGLLQNVLRKPGVPVLRRVKAREMLADDLIGGVAFDALGTGVPACNMSLGVEHEDGVIDNRLDQLLVSASIEPAGFVALRHRLSLKRVLAGHGQRTREARLLIPAELGGSGTTFPLKCERQPAGTGTPSQPT